jgi:DNA-binding transcriptional LysR family regulator
MDNRAMLDWNDLRYLLAVARVGSTIAAGKALGRSQSTVHRRLTELEARMGCELVKRHPTGYRLTEFGERLLPYAERVQEAMRAFERQSLACKSESTGTVRVTCGSMIADRLQRLPLIDTFHARHPDFRVELVMTERRLDLSKREADVAIRAGEPHGDMLVGRKIAEARWAVYASRSYIKRHGGPKRPEDIQRHFVVGCDEAIAHYPAARWLRSVAPHATIATRSDNWPGLVLAVKSGAGLAPLQIVHGDSESELVRLFDIGPELVTPYFLLTHRDMQRMPRVSAFMDFVDSEIEAFRALLSGNVESQQTVISQ